MAYHLEYVDKPGKFDEVIEQDGVKVLIDSKALFSIVGSEMDWQEDKISSKFVFKSESQSGSLEWQRCRSETDSVDLPRPCLSLFLLRYRLQIPISKSNAVVVKAL
jgi:hypothetical protein